VTTFQWLRREFAHEFPGIDYPNWGFTDVVGVPPGSNILRVIMRASTYGDIYPAIVGTDWIPAAGQVSHVLSVFRGALEDSRLATVPVPFQPAWVRLQDTTLSRGFAGTWDAPPVHVDIEARRSASTGNQGNLDIGYSAVYVLGPLQDDAEGKIIPNVAVYSYVDVLTSIPGP
jgi:uncharacterized protein Veg